MALLLLRSPTTSLVQSSTPHATRPSLSSACSSSTTSTTHPRTFLPPLKLVSLATLFVLPVRLYFQIAYTSVLLGGVRQHRRPAVFLHRATSRCSRHLVQVRLSAWRPEPPEPLPLWRRGCPRHPVRVWLSLPHPCQWTRSIKSFASYIHSLCQLGSLLVHCREASFQP